MRRSNKLLIDETPIQIQPTMVCVFGLNEAIFLQQLHYLSQYSTHIYDDRKWVYNSYNQWQERFPFMSLSSIKRLVKKLKDIGILILDNYNTNQWDRTSWYAIDYDVMYDYVEKRIAELKSTKKETKYYNPHTREEIPADEVPDDLKTPLGGNLYKNNLPTSDFDENIPLIDDTESDFFIDSVKMKRTLGQNKTMCSSLTKKSSNLPYKPNKLGVVQNEPTLAQNEPTLAPSGPTLAPSGPTIPIEYNNRIQQQTTATDGRPQYSDYATNRYNDHISVSDAKLTIEGYKIFETHKEDIELCLQYGITPTVPAMFIFDYPYEVIQSYIKFTCRAVKSGHIKNPSGFFIDAICNGYDVNSRFTSGDVPSKVVKKTEEDIHAQYEREMAEMSPLSPDSPFYKYLTMPSERRDE